MRALLFAMAAGIALSGCNTTDQSVTDAVVKTNTKIENGLNDACPQLQAAHTAFILSSIFIAYPQKVIDAVQASYAGVQTFCADPASVTLQSSVSKVLQAVDDIKAAKSGG